MDQRLLNPDLHALLLQRFLLVALCFASTLAAEPAWKLVSSDARECVIEMTFDAASSPEDLEEVTVTIGLPSPTPPRLNLQILETSPLRVALPSRYLDVPAQPARLGEPERYRDLDVAALTFFPVMRGEGASVAVRRVRAVIKFPSTPMGDRRINRNEEALYRNRIINWTVAKGWVKRPAERTFGRAAALPDGEWYRFTIAQDGIYSISRSALAAASALVASVDPRTIHLFTNPRGGRPFRADVGLPLEENLVEVACRIDGEDDGTFDSSDLILFYGRGPSGMDPYGPALNRFTTNPFSTANVYWLLIPSSPESRGHRVGSASVAASPLPLDYALSYVHLEQDLDNPFEMGTLWVGPGMERGRSVGLAFNLRFPNPDVDAELTGSILGGSKSSTETYASHNFEVYQGTRLNPPLIDVSWTGMTRQTYTLNLDESLLGHGPNIFLFDNSSADENSKLYIDANTLRYGRFLQWEGSPFEFWAPPNVTAARFSIASAPDGVAVWNVTNFASPESFTVTVSGTGARFDATLSPDTLSRFVVFSPVSATPISSLEVRPDQQFDLLRRDQYPVHHIVIAPQEFSTTAQRIATHRSPSIVAEVQTIYDEFAGGMADPVAVRMFLKWTKEHWRDPVDQSYPGYVLLLGDGDYDFRNITGRSVMKVPTFPSASVGGASSDDRFAYLDGNTPDIAIGRFPARTNDQAEAMVAKTIAYEQEPEYGPWRRRVTLIADDFARPNFSSIELTHTKNSELLAAMFPPGIEARKIYMEDFPIVPDGSQYGVKKPDATEALFDVLREGTALLNYVGHGSPYQWAQEGLFSADRGDLGSVETGRRLPLWVAATCSWGHYDLIEGDAMSEELLRLPDNGAVGVISTNGLITFSANKTFILQLFSNLFPDGSVTEEPIGAVFQSIKTGGAGSELFHLLADPGLRLALPHRVLPQITVTPDTLFALARGTYSGTIDVDGPAEGGGYAAFYDAPRTIQKEYSSGGYTETVTYELPGATLFRGQVIHGNTVFDGEFIVPKDVSFFTSSGKLVVYVYGEEGDGWEALGVADQLTIAGGEANPSDQTGPIIGLEHEGRILQSGDHIPPGDEVTITISDPVGINLTREVGHTVDVWFGEDPNSSEDVTTQFYYNPSSSTTGTVDIELPDSDGPEITVSIRAWDNANNPSIRTVRLGLASEEGFDLLNVFNYPNPFSSKTQFGFEVTEEAEVRVVVFTLAGQRVTVLEPEETFVGYGHIDWDGRDYYGDPVANGVYLYQVEATSLNGSRSRKVLGKAAKYR